MAASLNELLRHGSQFSGSQFSEGCETTAALPESFYIFSLIAVNGWLQHKVEAPDKLGKHTAYVCVEAYDITEHCTMYDISVAKLT